MNESPTGLLLCTVAGAAKHDVPTLPGDELIVLYELRGELSIDQVREWAERVRAEGHEVVVDDPLTNRDEPRSRRAG